MLIQSIVIMLQVAVIAAFLILWYFWVRKKMAASFLLEDKDHEQVLFPFRYFSWIFISVIIVLSLVTVHFVRVAAGVHERFASFSGTLEKQEQQAKSLDDLKGAMEKMRLDMESNFKSLRAQSSDQYALMKYMEASGEARLASNHSDREPLVSIQAPVADTKNRFANEAKASTASRALQQDLEKTEDSQSYSVKLSRVGKVTAESLRVRQRPKTNAQVIEQLSAGQEVKVTEKRVQNENTWFRVITPAGKAGWVDFRFLKLEGNA
jgi:hypothetical protein